MEDDSELSRASPESGVFPVDVMGEVPSLNKDRSPDLCSELTIDQGLCLTVGVGVDFNLKCFRESASSEIDTYL